MGKTKEILKRLDDEDAPPTKEDLEIFIKEVKEEHSRLLKFIKLNIHHRKDYAEILRLNFKDHRIQSVVAYIMYIEYKKPQLLSFDDFEGLHDLLDTYSPEFIPEFILYIKSSPKLLQ